MYTVYFVFLLTLEYSKNSFQIVKQLKHVLNRVFYCFNYFKCQTVFIYFKNNLL